MFTYNNDLSHEEINRYSRHLILDEVEGQVGQLKLKNKKVVVVGAGGLGNVVCCYLAAAGIGHITIIDFDHIELSNLNRQIVYTVEDINLSKAETLRLHMIKQNPLINVNVIIKKIDYDNVIELLTGYDVVVDCTDNVASRYCINDGCTRIKVPLVFGSALGFDGQLSVYGYKGGPCLRCIYPQPPPVELVGSCNDNGIIGPVVGIIGSMQALEAIKVLLELDDVLSSRMLIFQGLKFNTRIIKLRGKMNSCKSCAINIPIKDQVISNTCYDIVFMPLSPANEISVKEYLEMLKEKKDHVLIDVRSRAQYLCANFSHSLNIPLKTLLESDSSTIYSSITNDSGTNQISTICIICRRGRSSRIAVDYLWKLKGFRDNYGIQHIYDIKGGFQSWCREVDPAYPSF